MHDGIRAGGPSGSARAGPERLYGQYGDPSPEIKADKKLVVAQYLKLTDPEGARFWPVCEAHPKDLQQINERLATAILTYAEALR